MDTSEKTGRADSGSREPPKPEGTAPGDEVANTSGVPLRPFYVSRETENLEPEKPGEYPFTRGLFASGYRTRLWTMRQYSGFGTAAQSNRRFRSLLEQGQTGLSVAFDLPTQMGYDSDHPLAEGETGKVGVAVDSLADMEALFQEIPLGRVTTSMTINAPAAVLLAMYVAVGEKQGAAPDRLNGTVQNDILKEYVARGTYIYPPRPSVRLAADLMVYCARHIPRWNAISVSGYHIRDAGATAVQEMAFSLANALCYVDAVLARGLAIDDFAPRISWIFNVHNDFFEEVAKLRALRRIWARLMRERYGAQSERSWMLRTHTHTGGSTLTAQQPENNIVRAAYQALAAVLGGVQSLALSCFDEGLSIPAEFAQQVALRTQQILAYETGVTRVADPLGGSYYVEHLTAELEQRALAELQRLESMGGAIAAVENGYVQDRIQEAAYRAQLEVETGERVVVGVNRFRKTLAGGTTRPEEKVFQVDPVLIRAAQVAKLGRLRQERDNERVEGSLKNLREAARDPADNLVPWILAAVRRYATLGEICGVLRQEWGSFRSQSGRL